MASSASELSWREVSWNGNFRDSQLQQEFQNFLHSQRSTLFLLVLLIGYALPDSFQDLTVTSSSLTEGVKAWLVAVLVLTGSFLCFTDWQKSKVPTPLTSTMLVFIHTSILLFMTSLLQLIAYLRSKEEDTVLASANVVRMDTLRIVKELFLVSATPVLLFMAYPDLSFHHYLMVLITSMVLMLLWMAWNRIDLMVWTCVWCLTLLSTLCYQRYQHMQYFFTVLQLTRALQEHEHHSNTSISESASNNSNGNGNRAAGSRDAMHLVSLT